MLKLPKDVVASPQHDAVLSLLTTGAQPLWEKGDHPVATVAPNRALALVLQRALRSGQACQGLEQIGQALGHEQKGLDAVAAKSPDKPANARISRVLFVANDGAERFYRDCDSLLYRYAQRLVACRLDVTGDELGLAIFGVPKLARAILVTDKKTVAQALLALVS